MEINSGNKASKRSKRSLLLEKVEKAGLGKAGALLMKLGSNPSKSFSAFGEDLLLEGILSRYKFLFNKEIELSYVDIGAWKPIRDSNTYGMYKRGITGTVVEPNPRLEKQWKLLRPRDSFLGIGVSANKQETLHIFHENASSNTFSLDFAETIEKIQGFTVSSSINVSCMTLKEILELHSNQYSQDFVLDIDVEGFDFDAIQTHDFESLRPMIILIEDFDNGGAGLNLSKINHYLQEKNYSLVARSAITSLYVDANHEIANSVSKIL